MESEIPYLEAIQKIPGDTAKQKYESLNKIIKETLTRKRAPGDFALRTSYGSPIPPVLTPLIEIEIAKVLKKPNDVISALKSDDLAIVSRGLQAGWMFNGTDKKLTTFPHFASHIFPFVSLNTRSNIIKRLSKYLSHKNEYNIAQQFFDGVSKAYDLQQAIPLLTACSENYIAEVIKNRRNIYLPKKIFARLFLKYPELAIRYLKLLIKSRKKRVVASTSILYYLDLLPRLIKKHVNDFIEIVNSFDEPLKITIGKKCAELFMKGKGVEALIKFPEKYLPLLPLKLVSQKLNKEQFELMFKNLFPKSYDEHFPLSEIIDYLEFQPQELKGPLIMKAFKDCYGIDLPYLLEIMTPQLMMILPENVRIEVARELVELNPNFRVNQCGVFWISYLPTTESIPQIKDQISKSSEMDTRALLLRELIYTCKVNNSEKDLLHVLNYASSKHRNEGWRFWFMVIDSLLLHFDLEFLNADYWMVLNEIIKRCYVKDFLKERPTLSEQLVEKGVHHDILNNIPIEERMTLLSEIKIKSWNSRFNMFTDNPELEKRCLETFIYIIPRKFPEDSDLWKENKLDTIQYLTLGLYNYNERVTEAAKKKQKVLKNDELLSLKNYPWLLEQVRKIIFLEGQKNQYKIEKVRTLLRNHERELYEAWFPLKETIVCVSDEKALNFLKNHPQNILENWTEYLKSCEKNIHLSHTKKFVKKCIWYKDIPIKFAKESLKKVDDADPGTIMILALLLRGPEFVKIIEPMIPTTENIVIEGEDAKKAFRAVSSIPRAINVLNPPPCLKLVGKFCQGDYLALGLTCLMSIARRVSVCNVTTFAKELVTKPVSVKKHGIRLLCTLFSIKDLCEFLGKLWKVEKHRSIREVIFLNAHKLLTTRPCTETWLLMKFCIEKLTEEDVECLNVLTRISNVPNEYIKDYFEAGLTKVENLTQKIPNSTLIKEVIIFFFRHATSEVCALFSEDYCKLLVEKFAFNFNIDEQLSKIVRMYCTKTFLFEAKEKLESRLNYFCHLLSMAINKLWNEPHPKKFKFYPMKNCFSEIINDIVSAELRIRIDPSIPKAMMNLFSASCLQPTQDVKSYLTLFFVLELQKAEYDGRLFGLIIGKQIPHLVNTFSGEMAIEIGKTLSDFMIPVSALKVEGKSFIGCVIDSLAEVNLVHSSIASAEILYEKHTRIPDNEYKTIVKKLEKVQHPAVVSLLNKHLTSIKEP